MFKLISICLIPDSDFRPSVEELLNLPIFNESIDDKSLISIVDKFKKINVFKMWLEFGYDYKQSNLKEIIEKDDDTIEESDSIYYSENEKDDLNRDVNNIERSDSKI